MITRRYLKRGGNLRLRDEPAPQASVDLERDGFAMVPGLLSESDVADLRRELTELFETTRPEPRIAGSTEDDYADFRYEALNSSPAAQRMVAHPGILEVIEPLLGEDCHVVSNTVWWNQPQRERRRSTSATRGTSTRARTCPGPRASVGMTGSRTRSS
jgi:hypothetical protein